MRLASLVMGRYEVVREPSMVGLELTVSWTGRLALSRKNWYGLSLAVRSRPSMAARCGFLLQGFYRLLARLAPLAPLRGIARGTHPGAQPAYRLPARPSQPVHDGEPRDAEGERQPGHPGGDQQQRRTEKIQPRRQPP